MSEAERRALWLRAEMARREKLADPLMQLVSARVAVAQAMKLANYSQFALAESVFKCSGLGLCNLTSQDCF